MSEDHLEHLEKAFQNFHDHKMILNPVKCTFRIPTGKLLGFIITQKGIKICLIQTKPSREMPSPKTVREIQRLSGRVAGLRSFYFQIGEKVPAIHKIIIVKKRKTRNGL